MQTAVAYQYPPQTDDQIVEHPLRFSASGSEYFRIWIVNILLTILTLGIYSAWAKVRTQRYLYGSTRLDGSSFEYHGNPVAILKGRIAAALLIGGYNAAAHFSPVAGVVMALLLMALMPWLMWRSLQFRLYNSSYRGIRFGFDGSAGKAYLYFLVLPLLGVLTLGLLMPFAHQRQKLFQHSETRFGQSRFSFDGGVWGFYRAYLVVAAGWLALLGLTVFTIFKLTKAGMITREQMQGIALVIAVACYLMFFAVLPVFMALIQNHVWNHTQLGIHQFKSSMRVGRATFIYLTNLLGIVCTLGLFTPFAKVRWARYRIETTSLVAYGSLDDFAADVQREVHAGGEGVADLMDFDLAL